MNNILYMYTAVSLIFTITNVLSDCCGLDKVDQCEDCVIKSSMSCCGKKNCNIFCCNCVCITADPCKYRCPFRPGKGRKRRMINHQFTIIGKLPNNAKDIVQLLDQNADDRIHRNEMITWFTTMRNLTPDFIIQSFKNIDHNNDDMLTAEEIDPSDQRYKRSPSIKRQTLSTNRRSSKCLNLSPEDVLKGMIYLKDAIWILQAEVFPTKLAFSPSEKVSLHMVTGETNLRTKMCGVVIDIINSDGEIFSQQFPKRKTYKCSNRPLQAFDISVIEPARVYYEWINYTGDKKITKIRIRTLGYPPLLIRRLSFTFNAHSIDSNIASNFVRIVLDYTFFKACVFSIRKSRPAFKKLLHDRELRFSKNSPGISMIEINNVNEFVNIILSHEFNQSLLNARKMFEQLCYKISVYNAPDTCKGVKNGCECNGLVDPDQCKPTRWNFYQQLSGDKFYC